VQKNARDGSILGSLQSLTNFVTLWQKIVPRLRQDELPCLH